MHQVYSFITALISKDRSPQNRLHNTWLLSSANLFTVLIFIGGFLALLSIALAFPKGSIVLWFNQYYGSVLNRLFVMITYAGDGLIFIPFFIVTLFWNFRHAITTIFCAIVLSVMVNVLKKLVFPDALRPKAFFEGQDILQFVPGIDIHSLFSFPSGHAATAAAVAVLVSLFKQSNMVSILALGAAVMISLSRVYLAQHFFIDIAAGFLVGVTSGVLAYWSCERWLRAKVWTGRKLKVGKRRLG